MFRRRVIPSNITVTTAVVCGPDPLSLSQASLASVVNTASPMSRGVQSIPTGLPGYGVNRFAGRETHARQSFKGASDPVLYPSSRSLGIGAGVSGSSSAPNTGTADTLLSALEWMTAGQMGSGY